MNRKEKIQSLASEFGLSYREAKEWLVDSGEW